LGLGIAQLFDTVGSHFSATKRPITLHR